MTCQCREIWKELPILGPSCGKTAFPAGLANLSALVSRPGNTVVVSALVSAATTCIFKFAPRQDHVHVQVCEPFCIQYTTDGPGHEQVKTQGNTGSTKSMKQVPCWPGGPNRQRALRSLCTLSIFSQRGKTSVPVLHSQRGRRRAALPLQVRLTTRMGLRGIRHRRRSGPQKQGGVWGGGTPTGSTAAARSGAAESRRPRSHPIYVRGSR